MMVATLEEGARKENGTWICKSCNEGADTECVCSLLQEIEKAAEGMD
jgi:hypothetical protein